MNVKYKLYRHYDCFGELLYVGISTNIAARLANHRTYSVWFDRVTLIKIETYKNINELRAIEKQIIEHEKPTFNVVHNRALKKTKKTDCFNMQELAVYLKVLHGRLRKDIQLNRFPIIPKTKYPFTWIKGEVDCALKDKKISDYIQKMRSL